MRLAIRLAFCLAACAQLAATPYSDPQRLDGYGLPLEVTSVVVTPRRQGGKRFSTGRSVTRVNRRALREMQADTAYDALRETPGVAVQQTNRGAGIPVIRGLVGPSNVVLIDGLRFNQATWRTGPSQYLTLLDPSSFRAYEVLTGPASLRYGAGAMGGLTNAVPWRLRATQGLRAEATLRFVSQDTTLSGAGRVAGRRGPVSLSLGGALRDHGTLTTGGGATVPLSDWQQQAWHAQVGAQLGPNTTVSASYNGARVGHAGRVDQLARGRMRVYDNADDYLALNLRHRGEGRLRKVRVALALHRTDEQVARFDCEGADDLSACVEAADTLTKSPSGTPSALLARERRYQDTVTTLGGLALADVWLVRDRLSLDVGVEAWADTVDASTLRDRRASGGWAWKDASRGNFSADTSWLESGLWAALDATLWQRDHLRLQATAGGRLVHFRGSAADVPGLGPVDYDYTGVVGSAGLRLVAKRRWMVYADVSQGFRAPNVQETTVLGDTGSKFEVPNGELGPEKGVSFELGGRVRRGGLRLHFAGYVNRVSDFVGERQLTDAEVQALGLDAADVDGNPVVQRVNRDTGLFVGVEGSAAWRLGHGFTPYLRAGWSRGDITKANGDTTPARRVMPLTGAGGLRWSRGRSGLWATVFTRFALAQDRLHPSDERDLRICANPAKPGETYAAGTCPGTPGWATVNVRGGWRWGKRMSLDLALTNLLDAQYRVHGSGFDAPGVGVSVSLSGRY